MKITLIDSTTKNYISEMNILAIPRVSETIIFENKTYTVINVVYSEKETEVYVYEQEFSTFSSDDIEVDND